ncbi:MAG: hypothetical protein LBT88_07395 [Oscillospiraceae bacterium]|jgi:hypothetical protein|nr:hypothetical protein [Oscillospiraceae bacterium]
MTYKDWKAKFVNNDGLTNGKQGDIISIAEETLGKEDRRLYELAAKNEPEITKAIVGFAKDVGAEVIGLDYRLKSVTSFARKAQGQTGGAINDIIRYTFTSSEDDYTEMIKRTLSKLQEDGYETIRVKNYWLRRKNPYNGVNTFVKAPNGQIFELQYHTPESFALKDGEQHKLYEQLRVIEDVRSYEYVTLQEKMSELSKGLKTPNNIEEVLDV